MVNNKLKQVWDVYNYNSFCSLLGPVSSISIAYTKIENFGFLAFNFITLFFSLILRNFYFCFHSFVLLFVVSLCEKKKRHFAGNVAQSEIHVQKILINIRGTWWSYESWWETSQKHKWNVLVESTKIEKNYLNRKPSKSLPFIGN